MRTQQKISLGSGLAAIAGVGMVLAPVLGWSSADGPWAFLLGLATGILAGVGVALAAVGLIELRRRR